MILHPLLNDIHNLSVDLSPPPPPQHGITEVKVEETADGHILHLQAEDTLIQLEEDGTHIVCDNNEPLRTTLRDLVLRFLQKLWPESPSRLLIVHFHYLCFIGLWIAAEMMMMVEDVKKSCEPDCLHLGLI